MASLPRTGSGLAKTAAKAPDDIYDIFDKNFVNISFFSPVVFGAHRRGRAEAPL